MPKPKKRKNDPVMPEWYHSYPRRHLLLPNEISKPERILPDTLYAYDPPSPDPYTSLVRADMYERASSWWYWWVPKTERLITAHGMKSKKVSGFTQVHFFSLISHFFLMSRTADHSTL